MKKLVLTTAILIGFAIRHEEEKEGGLNPFLAKQRTNTLP